MSGAERPGGSAYSLLVDRYSLIVMVAVPGNWRGEKTDEICNAYMKALD